MARKEKAPPSGPNNGYLVSFGDTMTALLAFFIVLNSLASEQTGANLCSGTGSFVQVTNSHGLAGIFTSGSSKNAISMQAASPIYPVSGGEGDEKGNGPDVEGDTIWVRDRALESYQQFLNELERFHIARPETSVAGEVSFDRMDPLPVPEELIDDQLRRQIVELFPVLASGEYELEIVIWATTPSESAWKRAILQSQQMRAAIAGMLNLSPQRQHVVVASARPWISPTMKRPSLSLQVRKLAAVPSQP